MHPIKKFCIDNKVKVCQVARDCGINKSYLSQIIMGIRNPSRELALKLSESTGINVLKILYNEKGESQPNP